MAPRVRQAAERRRRRKGGPPEEPEAFDRDGTGEQMEIDERGVFISYRRSISWSIARLVHGELVRRDYDVFMDTQSLSHGKFDEAIRKAILARRHFVVVLEPRTIRSRAVQDDWMYREIQIAMTANCNIVPVTIDGFDFSHNSGNLPKEIESLQSYNAVPLFHQYFDAGIERLCSLFLRSQNSVLPDVAMTGPSSTAGATDDDDEWRYLEDLDEYRAEHDPYNQEMVWALNHARRYTDVDPVETVIHTYDMAVEFAIDHGAASEDEVHLTSAVKEGSRLLERSSGTGASLDWLKKYSDRGVVAASSEAEGLLRRTGRLSEADDFARRAAAQRRGAP